MSRDSSPTMSVHCESVCASVLDQATLVFEAGYIALQDDCSTQSCILRLYFYRNVCNRVSFCVMNDSYMTGVLQEYCEWDLL